MTSKVRISLWNQLKLLSRKFPFLLLYPRIRSVKHHCLGPSGFGRYRIGLAQLSGLFVAFSQLNATSTGNLVVSMSHLNTKGIDLGYDPHQNPDAVGKTGMALREEMGVGVFGVALFASGSDFTFCLASVF